MGRIKSLASDTMIYGVFTVIGRFLTFMLTPIYSNYLSKVAVGDISYFFSIIAFINIIYAFGMETAFFRFYDKDNKIKTKQVFSTAYFTILTIAFITSALAFAFAVHLAPYMSELPNAMKLVQLAAFLPLLDSLLVIPMAMLRMTRQAKRFAWVRFLMIIVAVGLNMLFIIPLKMGAEGVFLAQLISSFFGIALLVKDIIKNLIFRIERRLLKEMLRFGLPTIPATLSGMILQVVNIPILKQLTTPETVALYAINNRLGIPMLLFVSVFIYAWKPFYMSRYEDEDAKPLFARVMTYFTFSTALIFLIVGFFIPFVVMMPFIGGRFINPVYWSGLGIVPIVLTSQFLNGIFNNFAAGFHITKKTDYLPVAIGIAAVLNIVLNFVLIPHLGIWGSALATLISYFVSVVIIYLFSRKIYPVKYEWKRIMMVVLFTAVFYIAGVYFTKGMATGMSFVVRVIFFIGFILSLFATKFFNKSEMMAFVGIFKRKKIT
jgi:O-antigen/teichoic acid export membrane protein